jgi:predicted alpha/beta hydrolase
MLANQGYDVWLGNNRGSRFSLTDNASEIDWNYSLDELAEFDIPCMFDCVLKRTGANKLIYIGHSQGSTQLLTAL